MLKAVDITKVYPSNRVRALEKFSIDIKPGEIMGLLGPNGAGKSTFVRIAVGVLDRDLGSLSVCGYDSDTERKKISNLVSWIPQEGTSKMILNRTGRENIIYYSWIKGLSRKESERRIDELLEKLNIDKRILNKTYRIMSGGQKQLTNIINGLVMDSKLLFCDEISVSIDPIITKSIYDYLREYTSDGRAVLLTSQNISEVENLSDRIAIIQSGKLVALDKPREISKKILKYEIIDLIFENDVVENKAFSSFNSELEEQKYFQSEELNNNILHIRSDNANKLLKSILVLLEKYSLNPSIESGKANLSMALQMLKKEEEK